MLNPMGKLILFGEASMTPPVQLNFANLLNPLQWYSLVKFMKSYYMRPNLDPSSLIPENKAIFGFNLIYLFHEKDLLHSLLTQINETLNIGQTGPTGLVHVGKVFSFIDLPKAIAFLQSGQSLGKVVVNV